MEKLELLTTLAGCFAAALMMGYIALRTGISPLVGYLLAGVVVGPYTPGFEANERLAEELAEIGVILLMFGVGLQFNFNELLQVRKKVWPGALIQMVLTAALGTGAGLGFGWGLQAAALFGLSISFASTVVMTRVLADANQLHTSIGHIGLGWLIVQDIIAVIGLVLLPSICSGEETTWWTLLEVAGWAVLKITVVIAGIILIGGRVIPGLLKHVARTRSRELFTLTVLVLAIGIAVLSAKLFDVSLALGAFLSGMVVARSDFSVRAASEALPMRDAFAVLFFVSVGMLFDPLFLVRCPGWVLGTLAIVLVGTPVFVFGCCMWRRLPLRTALGLAVALAQIGEFSFILASLGTAYGVLDKDQVNTIVAVAILSISLNPLLYRAAGPISDWFVNDPGSWLGRRERNLQPPGGGEESELLQQQDHAIVIGYGPVGQTMSNLLCKNSISPTVIEMNHETYQRLKATGRPAVYGDATHRDTLVKAGAKTARTLILSSSSTERGTHIVRTARELNPDLEIFVRVPYLKERELYLAAGAREVFADEGEMAMAMTEAILTGLGATLEQIDRERAELRTSFFGVEPKVVARQALAGTGREVESQLGEEQEKRTGD